MKSANELKEMTSEELNQALLDAKKELFNLRLQQVSGQLENPTRIRMVRRSVARIKTIQAQKEVVS